MGKKSWIPALGLLNQVGISMLVPILGCMLLGGFIDQATGHSPLWLVIFIILGVGSAFRNLFYIILKEEKKGKKR
ncbi:MAG: AtpZ/AtpI family protein [Cellulosilyticaceae bacterium]